MTVPAPGTDATIALGANLGDPLSTLRGAAAALSRLGTVSAWSRLYRTAPVGGPPGQPDYLNAAVLLRTTLPARDLLRGLHSLEAQAGRQRRERWEARVLDLDLITYGTLVHTTADLTVPHPRAWDRAFVLAPLNDLNPHLPHPRTGETVAAALARADRRGLQVHADTWFPAQ
ncbi:2-amino-4-hydroxy-6-hydroxymethyldihydropteridine diphosphokinase [Deinococcus taeanensis]|uniref:2-amino-4-hydroxy-6- hydroxymethyldihydropteridine diphosphokinase n=1 Tax=Deinococcus taeanensis TaxID=2737050 RepID=UPI001CDBFF71|nr:2-amino-4-hydroxy-6-hydroxymethyldihydropteridine diphosphokinase [Deinococcus taeanensis]UBV42894.1 2-amino-4-hydroxy-6-hydroxymethyldihydropteridine diphosphokinase [Deinococcus taeanensis]